MDIELTLINQSTDQNNSSVVIFQQNVGLVSGEAAAPAHVLNCPPGQSTTFTLTFDEANLETPADGKSLATQTAEAAKDSLKFKPTIWVGAVSQMQEGEVLDSAILSNINTELSLLGITKANLTLTGDRAGNGKPFTFTLTPIA